MNEVGGVSVGQKSSINHKMVTWEVRGELQSPRYTIMRFKIEDEMQKLLEIKVNIPYSHLVTYHIYDSPNCVN